MVVTECEKAMQEIKRLKLEGRHVDRSRLQHVSLTDVLTDHDYFPLSEKYFLKGDSTYFTQ